MERRNRSLKALEELTYVDSLESYEKADALVKWCNIYLQNSDIMDFDLKLEELKNLSELFYKNIDFLKKHKDKTRQDMIANKKMQNFLDN